MELRQLRELAAVVRGVVQDNIRRVSEQKNIDYTDFGCPHDLEGACGYASWGLWKVLPGSTLVLGAWDGCTHCWVEYREFIVDITATQFGAFKKVRIIPKNSRYAKAYSRDHFNSEAEEQLQDWYPSNWDSELLRLLESHGVTNRRAA
jgi:hypothetical protein